MTGSVQLPPEIHAKILQNFLRAEPLDECLRLRLVNKHFSHEVFRVLFDQGEIDRRLYKSIIRRRQVHPQFACRYWEVFFRKVSLTRQCQRPPSSRKLESRSSSHDRTENSSENDSQTTSARESSDERKSRGLRRLDQVRAVIHAAIAMESSLRPAVRWYVEDLGTTKILEATESNFEASLMAICTAACQLLGGKDSMTYLAKKRSDFRYAGLRSRHLVGKPCEFWVLLSVIWSENFELAKQHLKQFHIKHRRETKWLARLSQDWESFSWKSSHKERQWLEVLAACLVLAANLGATDFFCYLINLEPGVCTTAFSGVRYGDCNALEATILYNRSDMFELLIERGWCLVQPENEGQTIDDYGRAIIKIAHNSTNDSRRDDIMRILFIMTDAWQHKYSVEMLLGQAVVRNDVKIIEMILTHLTNHEVKLADQYGTRDIWQCHSSKNVLLIAARLQHIDVLRSLLRHRRQITHVVPAAAGFINRENAVLDLVNCGEPIPLACLEEILKYSDDVLVQEQFFLAAETLNVETVAVFAQNMDLTKLYSKKPHVLVLDNGEEIIVLDDEADKEKSLSPDPPQTVGEHALCMALSALKIHTVRMLVEEFGVKLTWGAVEGLRVWEDEKEEMEILDELSRLLAEHGMFMQTKVIYVPSFHPLAGNSLQTGGGVRRRAKSYESESESDEVR